MSERVRECGSEWLFEEEGRGGVGVGIASKIERSLPSAACYFLFVRMSSIPKS